MYGIEEMLKNTNLMLEQGIDLITDSMSDIVNDQRSGMIELQNTYEQLLKLKNIEESI
jgi:sulfur relay (sulfurtransferase) DsrF/TusC family protein